MTLALALTSTTSGIKCGPESVVHMYEKLILED